MATFLFAIIVSLLHCAFAANVGGNIKNYAIQFAFRKHSFMTERNWNVCVNYTVDVRPDPSVHDYGKYLSKTAATILDKNAIGGSIRLADGVYPVKTAITLPSRTCLVGMGMDRTIIKVVPNANYAAPVRGVIRIINSTRVTLRGLTVHCNMKMQENPAAHEHFAKFGVFIEASNYTFIWEVRVKEALGYGFDPHGSSAARGKHIALEGCIADSCLKDGFKISRVNHASVVNCLSLNSGRHGIYITKGSHIVSVEGNMVVDSGFLHLGVGSGIMVAEKDGQWPMHVRVLNNRVHNSRYSGILLNQAMSIEIEKTAITNNGNRDAYCFKTKKAERYTMVSNFCDAAAGKEIKRDGGENPTERCVGKSAAGACCPNACGTCGGTGCSSRLPPRGCCSSHIKMDKKKCIFNEPPCVM